MQEQTKKFIPVGNHLLVRPLDQTTERGLYLDDSSGPVARGLVVGGNLVVGAGGEIVQIGLGAVVHFRRAKRPLRAGGELEYVPEHRVLGFELRLGDEEKGA